MHVTEVEEQSTQVRGEEKGWWSLLERGHLELLPGTIFLLSSMSMAHCGGGVGSVRGDGTKTSSWRGIDSNPRTTVHDSVGTKRPILSGRGGCRG